MGLRFGFGLAPAEAELAQLAEGGGGVEGAALLPRVWGVGRGVCGVWGVWGGWCVGCGVWCVGCGVCGV